MLSYRHAFHAGNHADVLKHLVLVRVLRYLLAKDKPLTVIDTHAGAGLYDLAAIPPGGRTAEAAAGIGRLWQRDDVPAPVADYLGQVRAHNPDGDLRWYPGSPLLAAGLLRPGDRLRAFERHASELPLLRRHLAGRVRRPLIGEGDGFAGLKAQLPPTPRRALVLLDPPYEDKQDYRRVTAALADALRRFATGCYLLWYPMLSSRDARALPARLQALEAPAWLDATLQVAGAAPAAGLFGSGVFVINPPWVLEAELRASLPWLAEVLGQGPGAGFRLESRRR